MRNDALKLKNQLCFPLYASAKEVVKRYKPFLDPLNLTYTQYITMMVMWEHKTMNVKAIGEFLFLDSGTLTPLLKKLEDQGYVRRVRMESDQRNVRVELTDLGRELEQRAADIPMKIGRCINLEADEVKTLYRLLYKVLEGCEK